MSYPRYFVTYAVMSNEAGANPFWHSFIITSEQKTSNNPIKVTDAVGFYSQPSSTTNPFVVRLKDWLGFKIDLQDGHGQLLKEEIRFLDALGIYGISFEVKKEKYDQLQRCYEKAMQEEKKAIDEHNRYLQTQGLPANGYTRYLRECSVAQEKGVEPRLKPFHIPWRFFLYPEKPYTCKTRALQLLKENEIIGIELYNTLNGNRASIPFPRKPNALLDPIQLVSTGLPESHTSRRTGKTYYSRSWDKGNMLHWTRIPTAYTQSHSKEKLRNQKNNDIAIKEILSHTRAMERTLLKKISIDNNISQGDEQYFAELKQQLKRVQSIYERFKATSDNQGDFTVKANLLFAESILNVAKMSLAPKTLSYPFILRAFHNIAFRYALLGLIFIPISAMIFTGLASVTISSAATLFTTKMFARTIQDLFKESAMHQDYRAYLTSKPKQARQSANALTHSSSSDSTGSPAANSRKKSPGLTLFNPSSSSNDCSPFASSLTEMTR